jgi:hypothetical protein
VANLAEILEWFRANRVPVFPVRPGTKTPNTGGHWAAWDDFQRPRPSAPYGVVLGRLLVVDTDSAAAETWVATHVPATPFMVKTARGWHRYFRAPEASVAAIIHRDELAIECRRQGQYVVGPGSPHAQQPHVYVAADWSWDWSEVPVFPSDFCFDDRPSQAVGNAYEPPSRIARGERHHELFRLLRHLKGLRATVETARFTVGLYNRNCCDEPLAENAEFEAWFRRAWRLRDRGVLDIVEEPMAEIAADSHTIPVLTASDHDLSPLEPGGES